MLLKHSRTVGIKKEEKLSLRSSLRLLNIQWTTAYAYKPGSSDLTIHREILSSYTVQFYWKKYYSRIVGTIQEEILLFTLIYACTLVLFDRPRSTSPDILIGLLAAKLYIVII